MTSHDGFHGIIDEVFGGGAPQSDALLAAREAVALRWSIIARIVFLTFAPVLLIIVRRNRPEVLIMGPLMLTGVGLSIAALWRLRQPHPNFTRIALMTSAFDVIALITLPVVWYFIVGEGRAPTSFLMKSEITTLSFVLIIINTMTLRPFFPALITAKVFVLNAVILAVVVSDSRTQFTNDVIDVFMGPKVNVPIFVNRMAILTFIGIALTLLAKAARKTLRDVVELERTNYRIKEEQAQRIMQGRMESLAGLIAGVAHEMNSPLGVLTSSASTATACAERIAKNDRADKAIELLAPAAHAIGEAATRLHDLVTSLKNFSRLDEAEVDDVSVAACLDEAVALIPSGVRGEAKIVRDYGQVPMIRAHPRELNQVFHTLIKNGLEAMRGRGVLKLATRVDGQRVVVDVEDSGGGIEPAQAVRIFDLEFRERRGRIGMGLGLPAAQAIVTRHGGRITVHSEIGVGSKFSVALPLRDAG